MNDFNRWLLSNKKLFVPQKSHAIQALRHLTKTEKQKLSSDDISFMRSAEGRWYEFIIYELFLDVAANNSAIQTVVLKGNDAPKKRIRPRLGQNGFFYSRNGDITIRGNGQDLAEFDLVMVQMNDSIAIVEVVTSPADLKDFMQEIYYKKQMIRYLFKQQEVTFILATSFPLTKYKGGHMVLSSEEHISISTVSCDNLHDYIRGKWKTSKEIRLPSEKSCYATDLITKRSFDYKLFHDIERDWIYKQFDSRAELSLPSPAITAPLVKKILFGAIYPSAIKSLCKHYTFDYKGELLDYTTIKLDFSKVIFAVDIPDYTPLIYLRPRGKKEFYKMVYQGNGVFKYERRTPPRVGFFVWLESLEPELGREIMERTLYELCRFNKYENANLEPLIYVRG